MEKSASAIWKLQKRLTFGGWGGIRTPEALARLLVFKTSAIDHSATHPYYYVLLHPVDTAAVDTKQLTGYETRLIRHQEKRGIRRVFGLADLI